jgi:hypothetical protein
MADSSHHEKHASLWRIDTISVRSVATELRADSDFTGGGKTWGVARGLHA